MVDQDFHQPVGHEVDESASTNLIPFRVRCRGSNSPRQWGLYSILGVLVAVTLGSCDGGIDDLAIENGTDEVLVISKVYEDQDLDEQRLEPGQTAARFDSFRGSGGPFRVRDDTGAPVMSIASLSRRDPRFEITDSKLEPNIMNNTNLELELFEDPGLSGREPFEMATLEPGEGHAATTGSACFAPLGARSRDGRVIARIERALCPGDSWIISESQS